MRSAATLLATAREKRHLSRHALANLAGVTASTVSRIEDGEMDPTITMLDRLLAATGERLALSSKPDAGPTIADLSDAISDTPGTTGIDWTRIRGFLDWLHLHPGQTEKAISLPPSRSSLELTNVLAAIAEKLADDNAVSRPRWTRTVPALPEPLTQPGTPRMVKRGRLKAAPQFLARNLWLAESDLWRPHD